jgi:hypothetical protein
VRQRPPLWVLLTPLLPAAAGAWAPVNPLITSVLVVAAVGIWAMGTFQRQSAVVMLALITLPVFYDLGSGDLTLIRFFQPTPLAVQDSEAGIQVAVVLVGGLAVIGFVNRGLAGRAAPPLVGRGIMLWLLLLYTGSILAGLMSGAGVLGMLYYGQTILPLFAWYASATGQIRPRTASLVVVGATAVMLLGVVGIALRSAGGIQGSYGVVGALVWAIPQFRSYFPFIVMCGLAFAVAGWELHRKLSLSVIILAGLSLPLMWSRSGLVIMVAAFCVAFFARPGGSGHATRFLLGSVGVGVLGVYAWDRISSGVLAARAEVGSTAEASGESRLALASQAFDRLVHSPVFGDMFVPYSSTLAGGVQADFARLFQAHNQYLDAGLRGGVGALILTVALLVVFGRRAWRLRRSPDPAVACFHASLLAIVVATALGNMTHLFMVQPWSGGLLFALLGVSSICADQTEPDAAAVRTARRAPATSTPRRVDR